MKEQENESKNLRETIQRLENHLSDQIKLVEEVINILISRIIEKKSFLGVL
jgi:hypothetical protein